MKKLWRRYAIIFGVAALFGAVLLKTSQSVEQAEGRLDALRETVAAEEESLRVLRAEWAYLNRPGNLEALSKKYLDLRPPESGQMVSSPSDIPLEMDVPVPARVPDRREVSATPVFVNAGTEAQQAPKSPKVTPKAKPPVPQKYQPRNFQKLLENLSGEGGDVQ